MYISNSAAVKGALFLESANLEGTPSSTTYSLWDIGQITALLGSQSPDV